MSSESLKEFYSGKSIFVSGATGYIGRLLIAKLLRLGNVKEILICSRSKKGITAENRLEKILSGFLFESMHEFDKSFRSKLRIVNCELELSDLGMSVEDREYIKNNVELIIHAGATVNFDEKLKTAIAINVQGTKAMLDLAVEVKNLKSFVYVSTAFSNCPQSHIKEEFYKPPIGFRAALKIAETLNDDVAESLTSKLISPWPNTYTFTKAIAEDLLREYSEKLPVSVIRPSIVVQTSEDPVPGFSDSMLAMLGMCIGVMAGVIRVYKCDPDAFAYGVPADVVVNLILAIAKIGSKSGKLEMNEKVFNSVHSNPCSWRELLSFTEKNARKYPTKRMLWLPMLITAKAGWKYEILIFFYHTLPAFFIDIGLRLKGSKFRLLKVYAKIYQMQNLFYFFTSNSWKFDNDKMQKIYSLMSEQDHKDFVVRFEHKTYDQFASECVSGIRRHFFKETEDDLIKARRKLKKLWVFKNFALMLCIFLTFRVISRCVLWKTFSNFIVEAKF